MGVQRFEDLIAWQRARALTKAIYALTREPELSRDFGLTGQIRRASVSVMSNIAEGFERNRPKEFHQALSTAKASCAEVRSLLCVLLDAGHLNQSRYATPNDQAHEAARLIGGLRASVARQIRSATPARAPGNSALSTQH